jgi:hypothetical protein
MTGQMGQDIWDRISGQEIREQNNSDRTAETGRNGQVGLTDHPGEYREGRTARTEKCLEYLYFCEIPDLCENVWQTTNFATFFRFTKILGKTKFFANTKIFANTNVRGISAISLIIRLLRKKHFQTLLNDNQK